MKYLMFSIFDKKVGAYLPPLFLHNEIDAKRSVMVATETDNNLRRFPEDYQLVRIGDFDDQTGVVTCHAPVVLYEVTDLSRDMKVERFAHHPLSVRDKFEQECG